MQNLLAPPIEIVQAIEKPLNKMKRIDKNVQIQEWAYLKGQDLHRRG